MKKLRSILLKTIIVIGVLLIVVFTIVKSDILGGNITVEDQPNIANTENLILKQPKNSISFDEMPVNSVDSVSVSILNKPLNTTIYEKSQRYYLDLANICQSLSTSFKINNNTILLGNDITIDSLSNTASIQNSNYTLRGKLLFINSRYYISLSDIEYLFNLRTHFDFQKNKINFVKNPSIEKVPTSNKSGRLALIRLEDFSAGGSLTEEINIEKMKILGDLFYSNNIAFHIAWVPRYKNPSENIDNDLLTNHSIKNVAFINLLDYLINKGAFIGLHGYTHQSNNETSLSGTELSKNVNTSEKETTAVIENALNNSIALNIPVGFFESSHYKATRTQKNIIQEYFKYLYEPYSLIQFFNIKHTKSGNIYIPTPLSYVKNVDPTPIINNLNSPKAGALSSFFYHPNQEYDFIKLNYTDTTLEYSYSDASPMQQIIKTLNSDGYITSYITDIK